LNIGLHRTSASVRAETAPSSTNAPLSSTKLEIKEVKRQPLTPIQQVERDAALTKLRTIAYRNEKLQPAKTIVPAAIPLLKHPDSEVRIMTVRLFQTLGRSAQDSIPHLIPLLQDNDVEVRTRVPFALAEMGDLAQTAVPQLKQMRHDPETAFAAYWALGFVDRDIRTAQLQKLFIGMQSTDAKTRNDARFALGLMQPKELKLQLIQLLKHKNLPGKKIVI
jgi:HEAT repeat protein